MLNKKIIQIFEIIFLFNRKREILTFKTYYEYLTKKNRKKLIMDRKHIKSKKRVRDFGEVFTPKHIINDMLDLVKSETERIESRFLEPACGTGNFLVEILQRKLAVVEKKYKKNQLDYERYAVIAVSGIYGIDLLKDNIEEAQKRLFDIFDKQYTKIYKNKCKDECRKSIRCILNRNIIQGDALTLLTTKNEPIVFSEWSMVNGNMIKRRDFTLNNLLEAENYREPNSLFYDHYDTDPAFIPKPVKEYPLIHFLKLGEKCL